MFTQCLRTTECSKIVSCYFHHYYYPFPFIRINSSTSYYQIIPTLVMVDQFSLLFPKMLFTFTMCLGTWYSAWISHCRASWLEFRVDTQFPLSYSPIAFTTYYIHWKYCQLPFWGDSTATDSELRGGASPTSQTIHCAEGWGGGSDIGPCLSRFNRSSWISVFLRCVHKTLQNQEQSFVIKGNLLQTIDKNPLLHHT